MFGLGKKKKRKEQSSSDLGMRLHVIPDVFYGGNDPIIYHVTHHNKEAAPSSSHNQTSKAVKEDVVTALLRRPKVLWIGGSMIFLLVASAATWYYVARERTIISPPRVIDGGDNEDDASVREVSPDVGPPTSTVQSDTPVDSTPTSTPTSSLPRVSFPRVFLVDSVDTDADDLTDQEEQLLGTNQDVWDTDGDGYYDGQEIVNLYSPIGFAPSRLIDSGLFLEYVNPVWKYRLYYPANWQMGAVDPENRQVLFSTVSGDFMEVRMFDKPQTQRFQDWFASSVEGERFQDLTLTTNRFQESVYRRNDGLVGYVVGPTSVAVLIYHPGIGESVSYRSVMRVLIESFRQEANTVSLPAQTPLPSPPTSSEAIPPVSSDTDTVDI